MMDDQWLVQIFADSQDDGQYIGTGYSIGGGLVLTARHVLFFEYRAEQANLKLVWPEQNNHTVMFDDNDIVFQGDETLDLAVIRCPEDTPFQAPKVELSTQNPLPNESWFSRGFLRAAKEEDQRKDRGITGEIVGIKGPEIEMFSNITVTEEGGWGGVSGAPIFVGDKVVAVIAEQYLSFKSYFLAVSIPELIHQNELFQDAVGITKQTLVDDLTKAVHRKLVLETEPLITQNNDLASQLIKALELGEATASKDIATHLITEITAADAIAQLVKISVNLEKRISQDTERWERFLYVAEQLCGWILINSIDPEWWLQNEHNNEINKSTSVEKILQLNEIAFVEVIISRQLLQQARLKLDDYGDIVPAKDQNDPLLFDAVSPDAKEIQFLSQIYIELRRSENAPSNIDALLTGIERTAKSLFRARDKKLIYYIVKEEYLKALKGMGCFTEFSSRLGGYIQFICCKTLKTSSNNLTSGTEESILEDVAIILRLKNSKRKNNV